MAQQPWIIVDDNEHKYLTGWNQNPQLCMWGNQENAIEYQTEALAQADADNFQSGFIHPVRKNPH